MKLLYKRYMKKIVTCVCLILSALAVSSCLCPPEKLDVTDCMLYDRKNGIVLELNEYAEAIEGKLGAPEEKVCLKEDGPGLGLYSLNYKNLRLNYSEYDSLVYVITTDGSKYETKRGIKVGDGISKVYKRYRKSEITAEGKYGNVDVYYIHFELSLGRKGWKDPSMRLIIRHDGKIITEISIRYDEVSL